MRADAARGATRRPTAAPCEPTLVEGLVKIRSFARVVDLEWQRALQRGAPADAVMALGEASLALHRALIALADAPPFEEVRDSPGRSAARRT